MGSKKIFIVSGPKHSGKTTRVHHWLQTKQNISGILTPVVEGERLFMNVASGEIFGMETTAGRPDAIAVGKYHFDLHAFTRAVHILHKALNKKTGWLVIDEVGPLELRGDGFYTVIKEILLNSDPSVNVVLVIRDTLVKDVISLFAIEEYKELLIE